MKIRNLSSRNLYLRDSSGIEYRVNAYNDLTISDTLWLDNEFRRWIRYRVRDIAVVDNDASIAISTLINTGDPLTVPFTIRGAAAQTVDLFQLQDNTTAVLARITKTGTVGIGVDPLTPAHVKGAISGSGGQVRIDASASNSNAALSLFPNRSGSIFEAARVLATYNGANQGQLMFYTNDGSGTLQQRVMIDEAGKFGIGGSPTKPFDVITSAQGDVATFRTTASSGQGIIFGVDTTNSRAYMKLNTSSTYSYSIQDISGNPMLSALNTDGKIYFGSPLDTNLYRSGVSTLKTDNAFVVGGTFTAIGTATAPTPTLGDNSTKIATTAFVTAAVPGAGSIGTTQLADLAVTAAKIAPEAINAQSGSYSLVVGDRFKLIQVTAAGASTITVPTNASQAFNIGDSVDIIQWGAGQVTIAGAGGVTVNGNPGLKTVGQYVMVTLLKVATDTWAAVGGLTP